MVTYDPAEQFKTECEEEFRRMMRECMTPHLTKIRSSLRWVTKHFRPGGIGEMWLRWRIRTHLARAYKSLVKKVRTETPPDRMAIMNMVARQNFEQEEKELFGEFFIRIK